MSQGKSFAAIYAEMNAKKLDENVEEVNASEKAEKKNKEVKEETEQLDEISATLAKKAYRKAKDKADVAWTDNDDKEHKKRQKQADKFGKKAFKKYTREETEVEDNQEHIEETEQLDELSKKTLGSYVKKASGQLHDIGKSSQHPSVRNVFEPGHNKKAAARVDRFKNNRTKGVSRAVDRLTKEETELSDNQEHIEETAAADTIKMHPTSFSSKASMMANVMGAMSAMTSDECVKWFDAAMNIANSKHMAQHTGGAEDKRRSVEMKGDPKKIHIASMKEDVAALFGSDELTEEFKDNATTLFESAVHARVISEVARIEEEYAEQLVEEVENIAENLVDLVDKYLDHAVSEWMTENEVAIESSLRNELAESFMLGMKNVFAEHYCEFPEDKVDLVSALSEKVEELEEALNNETNKTMELSEQLAERSRDDIFAEVSAGLALTQKDKFETLAEGVAFDGDTAGFKKKLELIKEHHFGVKAKPSLITEQVDDDQEPTAEVKYLEPQIAAYARAIKTTLKR